MTEVSICLITNPTRLVSVYQIAKLFENAFLKATTILTAINALRKTRIWPINPNIFNDVDFVPLKTTI